MCGDPPVSWTSGDLFTPARLLRPLEALAFWTAIALPFLYIPLLFYGLESPAELAAFVGLVGLNVVAFVIGHRYKRP